MDLFNKSGRKARLILFYRNRHGLAVHICDDVTSGICNMDIKAIDDNRRSRRLRRLRAGATAAGWGPGNKTLAEKPCRVSVVVNTEH